jgi:uncharacterized membrane protein YfcA
MSPVGTTTHIVTGEFGHGVRRTLALGAGVLAGAQLGAALSQRVHGAWILRALALGILAVGARLVLAVVLLDRAALQPLAQMGEALALDERVVLQSHALVPSPVGFATILVIVLLIALVAWLRARKRAGADAATARG